MRDSFVFYRSFYDAIKDLPRDVQGEIYTAIMEYSLYGKETENLKPIARSVFTLMKPQIDVNNKRFENGKKGGRPKSGNEPDGNQEETKEKPSNNQSETKSKPNVNDNVNVNVNVNDNIPPISPLGGEGVCESEFEAFWEAYPKKASRLNALKSWEKLNPDSKLIREISAALESQKKSEQWKKENGRFIPYAAKWLNERRWEDIPEPESTAEEKGYSFDLGEIKKLANNFGGK